MGLPLNNILQFNEIQDIVSARWQESVKVRIDLEKLIVYLSPEPALLPEVCDWLFSERGYAFATMVVEERDPDWVIRYLFYGPFGAGQVQVIVRFPLSGTTISSISPQIHAADWQEREIEDLFGLFFEGHPRLGDFVLHEEWPEGVNPMRASFDAGKPYPAKEPDPGWRPNRILEAPGSFMMPIGPVYSDHAESAHFLLETVGEDVIRTIPRFFYKYRGVEKIAEGQPAERVVLLAERFSGTSAFAHSLAFCQAVEEVVGIEGPARAKALRVLLAELERLRHHMAAIAGICSSTALSVAAAQASVLEEELLRLTCGFTGHRYLFALNVPGGLSLDLSDARCTGMSETLWGLLERIKELHEMLRFTSSFLDRLEEVGVVSKEKAVAYGLVGPIARASGVSRDLREAQPYAGYDGHLRFLVPREEEGDGYARLRVLFSEAEQSVNLIRQVSFSLPPGPVRERLNMRAGAALGWAEAPRGATFHWVRLDEKGRVGCYRVMTPSFVNWHGFHLAAEDFAFQDFPIIMATFGLSNAECDR
ncbi:MAG: NADH-quinone oxidoreductase subunit C [Desulfatiglandaceae bacterium]|jgi:Ni,Fe-hydrogenase III large subunit/Ni,Fe-hydrogenase III component G